MNITPYPPTIVYNMFFTQDTPQTHLGLAHMNSPLDFLKRFLNTDISMLSVADPTGLLGVQTNCNHYEGLQTSLLDFFYYGE